METKVVKIQNSGMDGEGIVKENGKVIFVQNAVEGDVAEIAVTKDNKNFAKANLLKVIEKSKHRCEPKCNYYGSCGGCNMQHINYEKTLEIKQNNIQNLINKAKLKASVNKVINSDNIYGYRNKITMYMSKARSLAFYFKNSKQLIDINRCELVSEKFNFLINKLNNFFANNLEYSPLNIKGVSIREINNIYILNFILTKKINFKKLENYLNLNKIKYSLYYCVNAESRSNLPTYPVYFVGGEQNVEMCEFGIKYPVYPMSFLQVNNDVKIKIYSHILSQIQEGEIVLDAYSGAGLLSACIAKKCKQVFAVEIDESASTACQNLCKINNINNLQVICGDVKDVVPNIVKDNNIDMVVLDPARKGVDQNTLNAIKLAEPKSIIYLSCNPATLCRDLKILVESGKYKIKFVQPYDMFPNTSEVETLVELERVI